MKKKYCLTLGLCFITILTSCKSTKNLTEYINIEKQPSAIIHIFDESSDLDFKLSKVNKIKIQKLEIGNDTIKVSSGKTITLHFEKNSTTSNTNSQNKTSYLDKKGNTYSWTTESSKSTVTVINKVQEIIFNCPELKENQEYTLSISSEGFVLEEKNSFNLITEGSF